MLPLTYEWHYLNGRDVLVAFAYRGELALSSWVAMGVAGYTWGALPPSTEDR